MLLFVVATLVVFHFALPAGQRSELAASGLLWVAILFTALLGLDARLRRRARAAPDRRARPRALRPQRDLAREDARASLAFLVARRARRAARLRALLRAGRRGDCRGRRCSPTSASARSARCSRRWPPPSRARELLLPLLFLPLAIPIVVGGVGASSPTTRAAISASSASTTPSLRSSPGRPLSTSLRNRPGAGARALAAFVLAARAAIALALLLGAEDADQGFSQRIFYFHVPIALTAYACFGWGAWKALRLSGSGERALRPRELRRHPPRRRSSASLTLVTGSIWAKISWGVWWIVGRAAARALPRPLPLLLGVLHAPLLGRSRAAARATCPPSTRSSASSSSRSASSRSGSRRTSSIRSSSRATGRT